MRLSSRTGRRLVVLFVLVLSTFLLGSAPLPRSAVSALRARLQGPLSHDHHHLLKLVRNEYLHPPSSLPYQLVGGIVKKDLKFKVYQRYLENQSYMFYKNMTEKLFAGVKGGFFVEAGALDGEFLSNTLPLELEKGWTGLLVEADGDMFQKLVQKHRRAWASHSCLATRPFPHVDTIVKFSAKAGLDDEFSKFAVRSYGSLMSVKEGAIDGSEPGHHIHESVQCLPLATLLLALNVTRVHLVSLDVEGAEMGVLRHFPWDRITVDVWFIEHNSSPQSVKCDISKMSGQLKQPGSTQPSGASGTTSADCDFINAFTSHGYVLYENISDHIPNYVFILNGTETYNRIYGTEKIG